jgi:hypothetical protein
VISSRRRACGSQDVLLGQGCAIVFELINGLAGHHGLSRRQRDRIVNSWGSEGAIAIHRLVFTSAKPGTSACGDGSDHGILSHLAHSRWP